MSALERAGLGRSGPRRRGVLALLALAVACGGETRESGPELAADARALRELIHGDPAPQAIDEADRVAYDRPVMASRMLTRAAIPAARRQVTTARELPLTTEPGRAFQARLVTAYEERVRGLERWQAYLADQATDLAALLEANTARRRADVAVIGVDGELDLILPLAPRAREVEEPAPGRD